MEHASNGRPAADARPKVHRVGIHSFRGGSGQCEIEEIPMDLSLELGLEGRGSLHFLPASTDLRTIASILFEGYDVGRLNEHLLRLATDLEVDCLILDTHLGINRETPLSLAICDPVLVVLRPEDQQGRIAQRLTPAGLAAGGAA